MATPGSARWLPSSRSPFLQADRLSVITAGVILGTHLRMETLLGTRESQRSQASTAVLQTTWGCFTGSKTLETTEMTAERVECKGRSSHSKGCYEAIDDISTKVMRGLETCL